MTSHISSNSSDVYTQFDGSFTSLSSRPFRALTLQKGPLFILTQNLCPGKGLELMLGQGTVSEVSPALNGAWNRWP